MKTNIIYTIEQQMEILKWFALDLLKHGKDTEEVNNVLNFVVFDRDYSTDINVNAIRLLAKEELGLHDHQKNK